MSELSGDDIAKLSRSLSGSLNFDDLGLFVHACTGDRLFVEYVTPGKPLRPTIVDRLNALEERGDTPVFLRYVYEQASRKTGPPRP